jgi:DNA-binding transcriptional MerR regulator
MQKAEMAEFIRRARREGVPFDEIDRSLLAEVSGLTASELAEAYREAARRDEAEAEQLENFSRRARAGNCSPPSRAERDNVCHAN